jgi:hypothetical protein
MRSSDVFVLQMSPKTKPGSPTGTGAKLRN